MKNSNKLIGIFILFAIINISVIIVLEDTAYTPPAVSFADAAEAHVTLDLNTATSDELQALDGIGPALAGRIIEFRNTVRPFETVYDLKLVNGIGDKLFAGLKDHVSVNLK